MEPKHIIWGLIGIAIAVVLLLATMFGIYKFYPEIIGLEPDQTDTVEVEYISLDTVPLVPTVEITEQRLIELQKGILRKLRLRNEKDSLIEYSIMLSDSIIAMEDRTESYLDSLKKTSDRVVLWKDSTNTLADSLEKLYVQLEKALDKIKRNEELLDDQEEFIARKQDTLEKQNFETYAKIYNRANPEDVAEILALIDERDASQILKLMSNKQAGKVLEAMEPNRAAAIMLLGTN